MSWLIVIGEREGLRWVVKHSRMAFRDTVRGNPATGEAFGLYVSRGAFHNPSRDEAQIVGLGTFRTAIRDVPANVMGEAYQRTAELELGEVLPEREGLPFKPLVPSLSFIKKKPGWGAYLRQTLVSVPDDDFEVIRAEFEAFASAWTR